MPRPTRIFAGMQHGHLTVVREIEQRNNGRKFFECRCDCGKTVAIRSSHFYPERQHCSQQCTFLSTKRLVDLTGKRFGRWTVQSLAALTGGWSKWNCRCDCGTERVLSGPPLTAGQSLSCGCLLGDLKRQGRTLEQLKEAQRERSRIANRNNPARVKAAKIRYEYRLTRATPEWLTDEQWTEMNAVYFKARRLTRRTGIKHQVDHIVPLKGKNVSGLHVPWNLQILTQQENVTKSNRYAELLGD
jgi:5-methylcytosine-specific restriction endonuclease McrA